MKKIILTLNVFLLLVGCLPMQENYQYQPQNSSGETNMSAWDFIKSRPDIFSNLRDVIRSCEDDSLLYMQTQSSYTYILINNSGMGLTVNNYNAAHGTSLSSLLLATDRQWVRNMLRYYIVDGYYHSLGTLTFDPVHLVTLWRDQEAMMSMQLSKSTSFQSYGLIKINQMVTTGLVVTPVTSNLFLTNGVAHVVSKPARASFN